jgi:RNA polymerase sigma-70 factor (ECF subfamily)
MNDQLLTSEENEFDPLLLMDDLIVEIDSDIDSLESDDEFESEEGYQEKKSSPTKKIFSSLELRSDPLSDVPLLERDQEVLFRDLIDQHQRRLYRFVIKYIDHPDDAADITQQAFVEAARTIASFRGDSKLSTWLFGIAMNMVRNYLSRAPHRVYKFETDEILLSVAGNALDPSEFLEQKQILDLVEVAFSELPEEMSEVLGLVAIDEISYQDAAEILSIPLGTVRSRVSRARAVLRAHFKEAGVTLKF